MRRRALNLFKIDAQWHWLILRIAVVARKYREIPSTDRHDLLMPSGYATLAWVWAQQAAVAQRKPHAGGSQTAEFYQAKIATRDFYIARPPPRAKGQTAAMRESSKSAM
jgi:hypothetical protein